MKRSTTEFDRALGVQVRAVRTAAGMTQSDLARAVGLTFQQIQKYEQGANRISASMLLQLGEALNADFSALVAPEGRVPAASVLSREEDALVAGFARLDSGRRRLVLELVRALDEAGGASEH